MLTRYSQIASGTGGDALTLGGLPSSAFARLAFANDFDFTPTVNGADVWTDTNGTTKVNDVIPELNLDGGSF